MRFSAKGLLASLVAAALVVACGPSDSGIPGNSSPNPNWTPNENTNQQNANPSKTPGSDAGVSPTTPSTPGADAGTTPTTPGSDAGTTPATPGADAGTTPTTPSGTTGGTCSCDTDCPAVGGQAGICVFGVCMIQASAACSAAGSTAECPTGSRCWGLTDYDGAICWPDCSAFTCGGTCDGDGSCVPSSGMDCDYSCGAYCSCQPGDCAADEQCVNGLCEPTTTPTGTGPGVGPGPTCTSLPALECTGGATYCAELVPFEPVQGPGYDNYPINGETSTNQYRSYLRRDTMMLIQYATAKVACKTAGWTSGDNWPLGLGDMSESDGSIPGTSVGSPGHPSGTHTNGFDIDLAYYQTGQSDNHLRPICDHYENGQDVYHCTSAPTSLDAWRSALFIGYLAEHPSLRVIGVDGQAGGPITAALNQLCTDGWIDAAACQNVSLAYEVTNQGYGWFQFHHHHMHVSMSQPSYKSALHTPAPLGAMPCHVPGCQPMVTHPLATKR